MLGGWGFLHELESKLKRSIGLYGQTLINIINHIQNHFMYIWEIIFNV